MAKKGKRAKGYARRKGHQFERSIAVMLRPYFPDARRQLEYNERDCKGVDIQETGPWKIQCKKLKGYASVNTIREVECNRALGEVPVLITAADGAEPMTVLPLAAFLDLLETRHRKGGL